MDGASTHNQMKPGLLTLHSVTDTLRGQTQRTSGVPKDIAEFIYINSGSDLGCGEGLICRNATTSHFAVGNVGPRDPWNHCPSWLRAHPLAVIQILVWVLLGRDFADIIKVSNQFILS